MTIEEVIHVLLTGVVEDPMEEKDTFFTECLNVVRSHVLVWLFRV